MIIEANFYPGQKVRLIQAYGPSYLRTCAERGLILPVEGCHYTVREIMRCIISLGRDDKGVEQLAQTILLQEINNNKVPTTGGSQEFGFACIRFEPLTNIKIFTDILRRYA